MNHAEKLLSEFRAQRPLRASSLIITLLGDSILNRGGELWLKDLIRLLEPFGINDRLTRTTVHRLTSEQWLEGVTVGRLSAYRVSDSARPLFKKAFERVYGATEPNWDGRWHLLCLDSLDSEMKNSARAELADQDWMTLGGFTLLHVSPNLSSTQDILSRFDQGGHCIWTAGEWIGDSNGAMVRRVYQLDDLYKRYQSFCERFEPLLKSGASLDGSMAWSMRTLLIHEYRKIMLRDPHLPTSVLPTGNWTRIARDLCVELYRSLEDRGEQYLSDEVSTPSGPLSPSTTRPSARFKT